MSIDPRRLTHNESEIPLATKGYRLCWCSCAALVLLRVAVGWHFLYEGLNKIESHRQGVKRFSAEGYLANSSGPFRDRFRSLLDDPDGLNRLEPAEIVGGWEKTLTELEHRYGLTPEQVDSVRAKIRDLQLAKENYFSSPETRGKINAYRDGLQKVAEDEQGEPAFVREHAGARRKELAKLRDELLGPVIAWDKELRDHVRSTLSQDQLTRDSEQRPGGIAGRLNLPFKLEWPERRIDQINLMTMCGLTVSGGLLVIGLFSRLSALWAAGFLALIYLANPAPPLGTANPADPGHYMYVNKELLECLAALVLAAIPTGRWLGLDALIRGLITRRLSAKLFGTPDDAIVKS
ncbi:MAG: DoxX family protein [Planctomycetes bacterium]|nr:DoxX family protein [Planctomycetota bacterium]